MGQLLFWHDLEFIPANVRAISHLTMSFFPFSPAGSISLNTLNCAIQAGGTNKSVSLSVGLYSLNGATLSLANSGLRTFTNSGADGLLSMTSMSVTQNITPGSWFFGLLFSFSGSSNINLFGATKATANAFPGSFIGGAMTESTSALLDSYATSNLDITGVGAMLVPYIIISS